MTGIVFVHGTGSKPTAQSIDRERNNFVTGVRSGLLGIGKLTLQQRKELVGYDTGLGLDVNFAEYHAMEPVARGDDATQGPKQESSLPVRRWACLCCGHLPQGNKHYPQWEDAQAQVIQRAYRQLRWFLKDTAYRDRLVAEVLQQWPTKPDIVIAHSMGTVVALSAMARASESKQPTLFVTLGSPLSMAYVYRRLEEPELTFAQEHRPLWLNVHDAGDWATLGRSLPRDRFPEVINVRVRNRKKDRHAANEYLAHSAVAFVLSGVARGEDTIDSQGERDRVG